MLNPGRPRTFRQTQIETLEERVVMTADALVDLIGGTISHHAVVEEPELIAHQTAPTPDFWLDPVTEQITVLEDDLYEIEQSLSSAHGVTGLNEVRAEYGFTGVGQTVAVIDSGIAYDHYALGAGYGEDYRVVGGWDFTGENDANPYDDPGAGSHGTHVAGIIGSDDSTHEGVAPGVDLVGLRVFDDSGAGYFSWVENALEWVYDNRDTFENPITAVNLSLGTNWNSDSIPSWAMLEDEFAALESVGIFISVSAGNSFTDYNTTGLSYPAASPYVVPVMAMDDSGVLSYFSQRDQTAIAAPGRWIYSTIPDYTGNNNGQADDFGYMSGTSMAAPYVAGASVLVREAMEFVGMTNIDQDAIYNHMLATADTLYDSATGLEYASLNIEAAIDALMPTDDYGSSEETAYDLGTIQGEVSTASLMEMQGVISTLADGDYFTFTAGATGTVTFAAANTTHQLDVAWQGMGGEGWADSGGMSYTMNVLAGQQYTVAISSDDGLGYYDLTVSAESTFTYTDWGAVAGQESFAGVAVDGETWFRAVAGQDGYFTVNAASSGDLILELYNGNLEQLDSAASLGRVDHTAAAGTEYFIKIDASASSVDVLLTNLVRESGSSVTIGGTSGDDAFAYSGDGASHTIAVNGVDYTFDANAFDAIDIEGGAGADTLIYSGSSADEAFTLRAGLTTVTSDGYAFSATDIENVDVSGGGGSNTLVYHDTAGDDFYIGWSDRSSLRGDGYQLDASGFLHTDVYATTGDDRATFYDSSGDDWYVGQSNRTRMWGSGYSHDVRDFDQTIAFSTTGYDQATFYDTAGDDVFVGWSDRALMTGDGYYHDTRGFERVIAIASTGEDRAVLHDSPEDDTYVAWADRALMTGDGFYNDTRGFALQEAYATTGYDRAVLHDSAGDDVFVARPEYGELSGDGFVNRVWGFDRSEAYATTGYDSAVLYDSADNDYYIGRSNMVQLWSADHHAEAHSFDYTTAFASTGNDSATFYDTAADDIYVAWSDRALMTSDGYYNDTRGFNNTIAFATVGNDRAVLHDTDGNDAYVSWSDRALMAGTGYFNDTRGFAITEGYANGGDDLAVLYDSGGDDDVQAHAWGAYLECDISRSEAHSFEQVSAYSLLGGNDTSGSDTLDYAFSLIGDWV